MKKEIPWVFVTTLVAFSDVTTIMIALNEWCEEEGKDKIEIAPELRQFLVELFDDRLAVS